MATLNSFWGVLFVTLFLLVPITSAQQPVLPTSFYGSVYLESTPQEKLPVVATWIGPDGNTISKTVTTLTAQEAEALGDTSLTGFFLFTGGQVTAAAGTKITLTFSDATGVTRTLFAQPGNAPLALAPVHLSAAAGGSGGLGSEGSGEGTGSSTSSNEDAKSSSGNITRSEENEVEQHDSDTTLTGTQEQKKDATSSENSRDNPTSPQGNFDRPPDLPEFLPTQRIYTVEWVEEGKTHYSSVPEIPAQNGEHDSALLTLDQHFITAKPGTPLTIKSAQGTIIGYGQAQQDVPITVEPIVFGSAPQTGSWIKMTFRLIVAAFFKILLLLNAFVRFLLSHILFFLIFLFIGFLPALIHKIEPLRLRIVTAVADFEIHALRRRINHLDVVHVRDIMDENISFMEPNQLTKDALDHLSSSSTGWIAVCVNESIVGTVTAHDVLVAFTQLGSFDFLVSTPIQKIMHKNPFSVDERMTLSHFFKQDSFHYIPVIHRKRLVGVASPQALLRYFREFFLRHEFSDVHLPRVSDVLIRTVCLLPESTHLEKALDHVHHFREHTILTVDEHKNFTGLLTEHDLLCSLPKHADVLQKPLSSMMVPVTQVVTATPGMNLLEALDLMLDRDCSVLPVILSGQVVGVVSRYAVAQGLAQFLSHVKVWSHVEKA